MALPAILVHLASSGGRTNPNDVQRVPHVVGVCSAGPLMAPTLLTSEADLGLFDYGPGVEQAAMIASVAGWPVGFTRLPTTTPSVLTSAVKQPANIASTTLFGAVKAVGGSSPNGDVIYTAKTTGVSIVHLGGTSKTLGVSVSAATRVITVQLGTDGGGAVTSTATAIAAAVNGDAAAALLVTAVAQGDGTGIGAVASVSIANGDIAYLPRIAGVTVAHVDSGNSTPLSVSVTNLAVTVNLRTSAGGEVLSTAAEVVAKIAETSDAALLVTPTASGTGAGLAGVWGTQTLTYGSAGTCSLSGTPVDRFDRILLEVLTAGTVGAVTPPRIRWSLDRGIHWQTVMVPASGVVVLADADLESGITATFSGAVDVRDLWVASSTEPTASTSDLITALTNAAADQVNGPRWGFFTSPTVCSRSVAGSLDTELQALLLAAQKSGLIQTRAIAAGETENAWRTAVQLDYLGFESAAGLIRVAAGGWQHQSSWTGRQYTRPAVFQAAARAALTPVHEDLGFTGRGALPQFGEAVPGQLLVSGVDGDGGVLYTGRVPEVSVRHLAQTGNSLPLRVAVTSVLTPTGTAYTLTVSLATDGGGANSSTAAEIVAAIAKVQAAFALVTPVVTGAGTGVAGSNTIAVSIPAVFVDHDERTQQGLYDARFITLRSYNESPGAWYLTGAPTMAPLGSTGYDVLEYSDIALALTKILQRVAFPHLKEGLPTIGTAESTLIPAGALTAVVAAQFGKEFSSAMELYLFSAKSDGRASASAYPIGALPAEVLRSNNYQRTRQIKVAAQWIPLGLTDSIDITLTAQIAQ